MAKRGRPSKKTIKKRKEAKSKSELTLLVAVFVIVVLAVVGYFLNNYLIFFIRVIIRIE